eukprot:3535858-Prymnesium_polylepis.1
MVMVEQRSSVQDKDRREEDLRCARGCRERFAYPVLAILECRCGVTAKVMASSHATCLMACRM